MTEPTMIERLRSLALCDTSHPADAASALIAAAAAVLLPKFNKYQIANMISAGVFEALQLDGAGGEKRMADGDRLSEPELIRLFIKRGVGLYGHANQTTVGTAMMGAALAILEDCHGTVAACSVLEAITAMARRGELVAPPKADVAAD